MKKTLLAVLSIFLTVSLFGACDNITNLINKGNGNSASSESVQASEDTAVSSDETSDEISDGTSDEISDENSADGNAYDYTNFTPSEKALFDEYFSFVIPFVANNEYYVEEYSYDYGAETEIGINFYAYGNTQAEFNAYRALYTTENGYTYVSTDTDEYGDAWYYYTYGDVYIDMSGYIGDDGSYVIDVYVYELYAGDWSGSGDVDGGDAEGLLTNAGKGLPTEADGVYDVDFTKAQYVKDVSGQYFYLGGCPTAGNINVLVIPVEFSDVTASSKGYTIDKIKQAFNGTGTQTDYISVRDYYYQSSYGKLDVEFTVLDSWFRPSQKSSYYANATMDYSGSETECGDMLVIDEALAYLESRMDLSAFDSDGNDVIDAVVIINTLEIDGNTNFQWAYRYWNLYTNSDGYYYEYDGVSANDYMWASYKFLHQVRAEEGTYYDENVMDTYTFIHEFGHVLGAEDYYDTAGVNEPMGGCDVMDMMMGDHSAYSKFNYGWLTTSRLVVAEESVTLTLEDFSKNGDTIIIANNWDESLGVYQEYYILMYYTNNGLNAGEDSGYFARDGIVMYHINATLQQIEYDGETYFSVYNTNTDISDPEGYGTEDNLIEFVKSPDDTYTYVAGDASSTSSANIKDDNGNKIAYTFTIDSMTADSATITFTKNN